MSPFLQQPSPWQTMLYTLVNCSTLQPEIWTTGSQETKFWECGVRDTSLMYLTVNQLAPGTRLGTNVGKRSSVFIQLRSFEQGGTLVCNQKIGSTSAGPQRIYSNTMNPVRGNWWNN